MKAREAVGSSRRRPTLRRFLFFSALPFLALPSHTPLFAQQRPGLRILERQVRLTVDEGGDYRVIDALHVHLDPDGRDSRARALPLLTLQPEAIDARGLGGDVSPLQVVREGESLVLVGEIPRPTFQVGVTYRLPPDTRALILRGAAAVDELSVFVDRGRIAVRPDAGLERQEDVGTAAQPSLYYTARDVPAGSALRLAIVSQRTGWRERFAVLISSLLATGLAGIWAWRRSD